MTPEQSAAIARIRAVASDRHDFDMLPILRRDVLALLSALEEAQAVRTGWQPIGDELDQKDPFGPWLLLGHAEHRWIRMGHFLKPEGLWYYSGTNERSQYNEVRGDKPTHWQLLPAPPVLTPTGTQP